MKFSFIVHPLSEPMLRLYGVRTAQPRLIVSSSQRLRDLAFAREYARPITNMPLVLGETGAYCTGQIVGVPALVQDLLSDQERSVELMADTVMLHAADADVIGLGAVCAIVGLGGEALREKLDKPVTTGNSLTCWAAAETVERVLQLLEGHRRFVRRLLLVGLPGTIADTLLSVLMGRGLDVEVYHPRFPRRVEKTVAAAEARYGRSIVRWTDLDQALAAKGVVVGAGSVGGELREADLRPGTVVVDVARPLDTTAEQRARPDLVVIEGEMVSMPETAGIFFQGFWTPAYNFVVGQGWGRIFACLAEPMVLCMEERAESFSLGRNLDPDAVEEIGALAKSHGFRVAALYRGREEINAQWLSDFADVPWLP